MSISYFFLCDTAKSSIIHIGKQLKAEFFRKYRVYLLLVFR